MSIERDFRNYIAAFNRDDEEIYGSHYADDVVLVIGDHTELHGKQAIFDFYGSVRSATSRTLSILNVIAREDLLGAELESEFLAREDIPDFTPGPMKAGDRLYINSFVFYDLEGGKYKRIRSATHRREFRPAADG